MKPADYAKMIDETARPKLAELKERCIAENILRPAVTYGFFPAASDGTKLTIYEDDHHTQRTVFDFPRQEFGEFLCLSDYVEPARDGKAVDYVGFMAGDDGPRSVEGRARVVRRPGSIRTTCTLHGLGVESAEALGGDTSTSNCAASGASARTTRRRCGNCSRATTAVAATRSATRRARTWKIRSRCST